MAYVCAFCNCGDDYDHAEGCRNARTSNTCPFCNVNTNNHPHGVPCVSGTKIETPSLTIECVGCGVGEGDMHEEGCEYDFSKKPNGAWTPGQYALNVKTVHHGMQYVECGEVIDALGMNFNQGEIFKANWRMDKKETPEYNLRKIIWFANRELFARGIINAEQFKEATR